MQLNDRSWLLNHTEGKAARTPSRLAILLGHRDPSLGALPHFRQLLHMPVAMGNKPLTDTLLFRFYRGSGHLSTSPVPTTLVNDMLAHWPMKASICAGQRIHGVRTGGAIEMALRGCSVEKISDYVGWAPETAKHYPRLLDILHLCNSESVFETDFSLGISPADYLRLNALLQLRSSP